MILFLVANAGLWRCVMRNRHECSALRENLHDPFRDDDNYLPTARATPRGLSEALGLRYEANVDGAVHNEKI